MKIKLHILIMLLIMHASANSTVKHQEFSRPSKAKVALSAKSIVKQPELSKKSKAKVAEYDKARSIYNNALVEYNKLDIATKNKVTFSFYKFDFIHDDIAQKYYDAKDNLYEISLELTEIDPNNFMMSKGGVLYRKVFTHPSLGTYEWAPYEDYDIVIENLDEFEMQIKTKRDYDRSLFDPVSQEAIGLIEELYESAEEVRQKILWAHFI